MVSISSTLAAGRPREQVSIASFGDAPFFTSLGAAAAGCSADELTPGRARVVRGEVADVAGADVHVRGPVVAIDLTLHGVHRSRALVAELLVHGTKSSWLPHRAPIFGGDVHHEFATSRLLHSRLIKIC